MVIDREKLLYNGVLTRLKENYAPLRCIRVALDRATDQFMIARTEMVTIDGNLWNVFFNPYKTPSHIIAERLTKQLNLKAIVIVEHNIDHIFAVIYHKMSL
ncbi:MAG: hypothetical protein PHD88_03820 [Firmicutes bacterium]|nr:hypothetical protein [Bacillota bacterium]MDD4693519.1 hypothetical protein [Bacillota bacterium]